MALLAKCKSKEQRAKLLSLLGFIVTETSGAVGHGRAPIDNVNDLKKFEPELIEVLGEPDGAGLVSVKATALGVAAVANAASGSGASTPAPAVATPGPKQTFTLQEGFVPPEGKRGGARESAYPFASMKVGHSFFVPVTADKPNPAKGMASTVSGVNKRYALTYGPKHKKAGQPTGKDGRKFTVRARSKSDPGEIADGARIYRIA